MSLKDQLGNLSTQMPGQNEQLLKQQQNTQNIQMKASLSQLPDTVSKRQLQQVGGQMAQQQAQPLVNTAQQNLQSQQQAGQMQLQAQQSDIQQGIKQRSRAAQIRQNSLANQLAQQSGQLKQELFDANMSFQKDELGRTQWNQRQLTDFAVMQAKSQEELANYEDAMRQEHEKKMAVLQAAEAAVRQKLQQAFQSGELQKNQQLERDLLQARQQLADKMQKQQRAAQRNAMILTAAGTIVGAGIGSLGGPAGAMMGANIGGAAGAGMAASGKVDVVGGANKKAEPTPTFKREGGY